MEDLTTAIPQASVEPVAPPPTAQVNPEHAFVWIAVAGIMLTGMVRMYVITGDAWLAFVVLGIYMRPFLVLGYVGTVLRLSVVRWLVVGVVAVMVVFYEKAFIFGMGGSFFCGNALWSEMELPMWAVYTLSALLYGVDRWFGSFKTQDAELREGI